MLEKIKYINHLNEVIQFGEDGIFVKQNDLRDFSWEYNALYSKIASFNRKITKKALPFVIYGGNEVANHIFEVLEKDVLAGRPGRLYVGDYYLKGYFYGSTKSDYLKGVIKGTLQFVTDQVSWIKESAYVSRLWDEVETEGRGYDYDYPYDYASPINMQTMLNTSFVPSEFVINIYGPVTSPTLIVGGHDYHVDVELLANEYLVINSFDKTIIKVHGDGERENVFAKRDLDSYIFEKIAPGANRIAKSGEFNYDITLLMERSEPEWI